MPSFLHRHHRHPQISISHPPPPCLRPHPPCRSSRLCWRARVHADSSFDRERSAGLAAISQSSVERTRPLAPGDFSVFGAFLRRRFDSRSTGNCSTLGARGIAESALARAVSGLQRAGLQAATQGTSAQNCKNRCMDRG